MAYCAQRTPNCACRNVAENCKFNYTFDFDLYKRADGREYMKVVNSNLSFDTSRVYVRLENLFNGDKLLGECFKATKPHERPAVHSGVSKRSRAGTLFLRRPCRGTHHRARRAVAGQAACPRTTRWSVITPVFAAITRRDARRKRGWGRGLHLLRGSWEPQGTAGKPLPRACHPKQNQTGGFCSGRRLTASSLPAGENMNRFINENWREVTQEIGPTIADAVAEVFKSILTNISDLVPWEYAYV